jgi:predicted homoserine dehydrogenase-like protein
MNYEALFRPHRDKTVRAALVGVGEFGATFVKQTRSIPGLQVAALCDRDVERAVAAYRAAGHAGGDIRVCENGAEARRALERNEPLVVADAALLMDLPLDILVEATGEP